MATNTKGQLLLQMLLIFVKVKDNYLFRFLALGKGFSKVVKGLLTLETCSSNLSPTTKQDKI